MMNYQHLWHLLLWQSTRESTLHSEMKRQGAWWFVVINIFLLPLTSKAVLPESFGDYSHEFSPLPGTTIGSPCRWEVKLDTVINRIPSTITEIMCRNPTSNCGGNANYQCRQIRAVMVVAYTEINEGLIHLVHKQNTTIAIGCSCVLNRRLTITDFAPAPLNNRKKKW